MASKTQASMLLLLPLLLLSDMSSSEGCPIVTYWGQHGPEGELKAACDTGKYEIINIAFLNKFGSGQTPELNLAGHCHWTSPTERDCTGYADQISYCQKEKGVKIFLSLGGAWGEYTLSSPQNAKEVADYLWTNYLSGQSSGLLGKVALDGIDFDIEQAGGTKNWDALVKYLDAYRQQKKFYLSAAPQCFIPDYMDAAIKTGLFDYIWVQFYNNPSCQYTDKGGAADLIKSWKRWTTEYTATKFYVGVPASPAATGSSGGYVPVDKLNDDILKNDEVKKSPKFGGVMIWRRYEDSLTGYSAKIVCTIPTAFDVVREPLVAMMKSASEVLYRLFSQY